MKKSMLRALAATAFFAILGPLAAEDAAAGATPKDRDAFVLFQLSYEFADYAKDPTAKASGKQGKRTLAYAEHVLSCGTHMNGELKESTKAGVISVKGSFAVKENPYSIATLDVDVQRPKAGGAWTGFFVVDGKRIAAELTQ